MAVVIVSEREMGGGGGGLVLVACCGVHVHVYHIQGYMHDVMLYKYIHVYTHTKTM